MLRRTCWKIIGITLTIKHSYESCLCLVTSLQSRSLFTSACTLATYSHALSLCMQTIQLINWYYELRLLLFSFFKKKKILMPLAQAWFTSIKNWCHCSLQIQLLQGLLDIKGGENPQLWLMCSLLLPYVAQRKWYNNERN